MRVYKQACLGQLGNKTTYHFVSSLGTPSGDWGYPGVLPSFTRGITSGDIYPCYLINAVKCKERKSSLRNKRRLNLRMHQASTCSWAAKRCRRFVSSQGFPGVFGFHACGLDLEVISPPLSLPLFLLFYQCDGCLIFPSDWGLMAVLPAMEVVANSGSSWMPQAPIYHFAMQLLILIQGITNL